MVVIQIHFPARRYHATPWDAHVNEGRIEWPPSPWRLLRALIAVGYNKLGWTGAPEKDAQNCLLKLSKSRPLFALPNGTEAHTRHYMPTKEKTAKVFDAFVRFADEKPLYIRFDIELESSERDALAQLVNGLGYLGRAESWVDANLLDKEQGYELTDSLSWCSANERSEGRLVRLLAPMNPESFDRWREQQVAHAIDVLEKSERQKPVGSAKSLTAAKAKQIRVKAQSNYPEDLISALQLQTSTWQEQGWPQPPGSEWVDYRIPASVVQQQPLATLPASPSDESVQAVLLAIDGEGKSGTVRPSMLRALPLMELLHLESIRKATKELNFGNLVELTGKSDVGIVLKGHQHAHWVPLSLFGEMRIDHVLVYCRSGFSSRAIAALSSIRWAYAKGLDRLAINLAGIGSVEEIENQLLSNRSCTPSGVTPLQRSRFWKSVTPLVLRKFVHKHGKKTPDGQIREELLQRGFDEPIRIDIWPSEKMVEHHLKGFVLRRKTGKQQPPHAVSWAATIEFASPQQGPICLGYASHFGLGMFGAVSDEEISSFQSK